MALPKEFKDALAIAGGKVGQPVEDTAGDLSRFIAKAMERAAVGERLGLPTRKAQKDFFIDLAKKSAASVQLTNSKRGRVAFAGASDDGFESAISEGQKIKGGIDEVQKGLKELGIDLPAELDKVVDVGAQLADCAVAIAEGAAKGGATGAAITAGACATGIGCIATAAGTQIGTVIGVISAAWQCGLFDLLAEGLVFVFEKIGELFTAIFDPDPENFLY